MIHSCKYLLSSFCHLLPVFSQPLFVILGSVSVLLSVPPAAFPLDEGDSWLHKGEVTFILDWWLNFQCHQGLHKGCNNLDKEIRFRNA